MITAEERAKVAEERVKGLELALKKILITPAKPFSDASAHGELVLLREVWTAWSRIQQTAAQAIKEFGS